MSKALQGLRPAPEVVWRAFQLNPDMPRAGTPRAAYRAAKFGDRARDLEDRVSEAGRADGIEFRFDLIKTVPNTFDAHRVLRRALREGKQDEVHEALFRAYFQEGRDIGDPRILIETAAGAGMDVAGLLAGDEEVEDVRRDEAEGRALGIRGVPFFVIDRAFGLSGAQPPDVLREAIRQAVGSD